MKVICKDVERIFVDGTAEEWLALEAHARNCAKCGEELRAWKELSVAAQELREYQEDPALWTRIHRSLVEQKEKQAQRTRWWGSILPWPQVPKVWQLGLAGAMVLALAMLGGYLIVGRNTVKTTRATGLLKDDTLATVERTERDYMKAIDKLAVEAKPQMESSSSPLIAGYQEKLVVLNSAIDELRLEAGQNPSNAHLRYQLLAMYQEKETTLRDILETKR
jgi:hypothetical protein